MLVCNVRNSRKRPSAESARLRGFPTTCQTSVLSFDGKSEDKTVRRQKRGQKTLIVFVVRRHATKPRACHSRRLSFRPFAVRIGKSAILQHNRRFTGWIPGRALRVEGCKGRPSEPSPLSRRSRRPRSRSPSTSPPFTAAPAPAAPPGGARPPSSSTPRWCDGLPRGVTFPADLALPMVLSRQNIAALV